MVIGEFLELFKNGQAKQIDHSLFNFECSSSEYLNYKKLTSVAN